jgi:hypothetical protein
VNPGSRLSPDTIRRTKVYALVFAAITVIALVVPALLGTFAAGMRGELSPEYESQLSHTRQVEIEQAKSQDKINKLTATNREQKALIERQIKILTGLGTKDIPTKALLRELPPCELEDGSTQSVCVWDGRKQGNKVGAIVVNIDHGKIAFYPQTNGWVVYK